jgi:hypothetical protein
MKQLTYFFIAALLVTGAIAAVKTCNKAHHYDDAKAITKLRVDSATYWRDLWRTEHATRQVIEGDREALHLFYGAKMDSLTKRLKLKQKQLQDMADVLLQAQGQVVTVPVAAERRDTLNGIEYIYRGQAFCWKDEYMTMDGYVDSAIAKVNYSIEVPVHVNRYWKRKWFLGKKRRYIDAYCDNPNVKITGLQAIKVN